MFDRPRFRELTTRPCEKPEVAVEPDGTVEVRWPIEGLTVLLAPDEAEQLNAQLTTARAVGAPVT